MSNSCFRLIASLALWAALAGNVALAQDAGKRPSTHSRNRGGTASAPTAAALTIPQDVRSLDSILGALYSVISGPAGQQRNWDRFRALFLPEAHLTSVSRSAKGAITTRTFSVNEYIAGATPVFARQGFFEKEVARHVDEYASLTQVFSTYESRHSPGEKPFERGINAIQLVNDGQRWWVTNISWEAELPGHPIPEKYLQH